MTDPTPLNSAHPSFPLSAPALQSAALLPDSPYFNTRIARQLSASLGGPGASYSTGEWVAIGLLGQVSLSVIKHFTNLSMYSFQQFESRLINKQDVTAVQDFLFQALAHFPTRLTYQNPEQKSLYALDPPGSAPVRYGYYSSLFLIYLAEQNPAIKNRDGFFTVPALRTSRFYNQFLSTLQDHDTHNNHLPPGGKSLFATLLEPVHLFPHSLSDQLTSLSQNWEDLIEPELFQSIQIGLDHLKEESFTPAPAGTHFTGDPLGDAARNISAPVHFSPDKGWMPQVVLQAKNIQVWLSQLSSRYQREITRLDQIPEEELAYLSRSGINALWLIGIWERSPASQTIKRLCGNPEAESSAYSLFEYEIANELGGEPAYQGLSAAAAGFGIKLAADMVPNHTGLDSKWVIDNPDWFLTLDQSPFPAYTFTGPDLSSDATVHIALEDHYYDKSDAAVVFKRTDQRSGESLFIYHGNDGTSMPWNDTAQLNFLNPDVREAVTQIIIQIARKFPIIRFDAAMTLTKKHFHRLWFPEPGSGGAIPTRSDFSLSKTQFDAMMPAEFWREVVDRVAVEAPDTLLLAEAFWMMEGYFVRNLGMHRVYNSAFMHMMRDEENSKFRQLLLDTLALDPQILKRYVNFMNNPDEETAVAQFGSEDKYFGTCLLMCTLPGLPLFGHGQIEGLRERYGMEYNKAYIDEVPDQGLMKRHADEIFPLLHKRYLFSGVDNFSLYDFKTLDETLNPNVFVYSNRTGDESALILFHNSSGHTRGKISHSTPVNDNSLHVLSGLGYTPSEGDFLLFSDQISSLEYIRSINDIEQNGLEFDLGPYQYQALVNFHAISDQDGSYQVLSSHLDGKGALDLMQLRFDLKLLPLASELAHFLRRLHITDPVSVEDADLESFLEYLGSAIPEIIPSLRDRKDQISKHLEYLSDLAADRTFGRLDENLPALILWTLLVPLADQSQGIDIHTLLRAFKHLPLESRSETIPEPELFSRELDLIMLLWSELTVRSPGIENLLGVLFEKPLGKDYLNVHDYQGQTYFRQEALETALRYSFLLLLLHETSTSIAAAPTAATMKIEIAAQYKIIKAAIADSEFKVDVFLKLVSSLTGGHK